MKSKLWFKQVTYSGGRLSCRNSSPEGLPTDGSD